MGRRKIGLALGGGAARGWAHIGVIRALMERGLMPDVIVGTSIGAVVGGCLLAGGLDALEKFARSLTKRKVFGYLDFNMSGTGLISGQKLSDALTKEFDGIQIEDLDRRFAAIATEIGTGHEIWLQRGSLVDAVRASYALPGIFRPVNIDGRWMMDGAVVNPIPVSVCRALGAEIVIAVNLHSEIFGRGTVIADQRALASIESEADAEAQSALSTPKNGRSALKLLHRQFFGWNSDEPGISTVMMEAFNITQDRIARSRLAGDPPDVLITPRLGDIGMFEFHRAEEMIAAGRAAVERYRLELEETLGLAVA